MVRANSIRAIRILPNTEEGFIESGGFRNFIENVIIERGGYYYFPGQKMNCPENTLVLFQFNGAIRATGILIEAKKEAGFNDGYPHAGYYRFDVETIHYLSEAIYDYEIRACFPDFGGFNQTKWKIPLVHKDAIVALLQSKDQFYSDGQAELATEIENEANELGLVGETREALVRVRINQSVFRERLLAKNPRCRVCGIGIRQLLVASHIKPWSVSAPEEKLDSENGLILCPMHDKLFDRGLVTFDDGGNAIVSDSIGSAERILLNIQNLKGTISEKTRKYLEYHREHVFNCAVESN